MPLSDNKNSIFYNDVSKELRDKFISDPAACIKEWSEVSDLTLKDMMEYESYEDVIGCVDSINQSLLCMNDLCSFCSKNEKYDNSYYYSEILRIRNVMISAVNELSVKDCFKSRNFAQ